MKMNRIAALLVSGMVMATMAGCGSNPTVPSTRQLTRKAPVQGVLPQTGVPGAAAGAGGAAAGSDATTILNAIRQANASNQGFTAVIDTWEKGPDGVSESDTINVAFKKPSTLRLEMVKATGQAQGAKLLWDGGSELKIKVTFLPLQLSKPLDDAQLKSHNGWTIRETESNRILKVLLDPGSQVTSLGNQTFAGRSMPVLQVRSSLSPKGVDHELIPVDPQTYLPAGRLLYKAGNQLVYQMTIKNMKLGTPSGAQLSI